MVRRPSGARLWPSLVLLCSLVTSALAAGSVLAIDYGADSFKASLIKPGVPFDVLLNRDSKRKTSSSITLRGEDRHVGGDSVTLSTRFPRDSVAAVKLLLGSDQDQLALHADLYANTLNVTSRASNAVAFTHGVNYTAEEVLAMQFAHAREMASSISQGEKVSDVIVTVPAFFDQAERQAVLDAIDLAGLKPLSLLNDGTAAGVNYAISRTFPDGKEHHLFYDAGAASVRATLISFESVSVLDYPGAKTSHDATQLEVLGIGWDRTAGGLAFDARLRDLLRADFAINAGKKLKTPVTDNDRAMTKLLKEAARVKHVLSANTEAQARIESLAEDKDFKALVTRDQFEAVCADMAGRLSQPIEDALAMANLTVADLTSVVLVGGHTRVPLVQTAIRTLVPEAKIAQNVNADEAAVMGAAFYGAGLSRQFRTKDIRVRDILAHGISLSHNATLHRAGDSAHNDLVLFPAKTALGSTHNLTFVSRENISLSFAAVPASTLIKSVPLLTANITGIDAAFVNLTDETAALATVNITAELGDDGILRLGKPRFIIPLVPAKAPSTAGRIIGSLFGGSKDADEATETEGDLDAAGNETVVAVPKAPAPKLLGLVTESLQSRALNKTEKLEARKRLREIEQAETRKRAREEARNGLEGYLYSLRDQLEDADFSRASTEPERKAIDKLRGEASDWLSDAAETAPTKDLRSRRHELEKLVRPITTRLTEEKERTGALTEFQLALFQGQAFHLAATNNATEALAASEPARHTPDELDALKKLLDDEQAWLSALRASQDKLAAHEDPILRRSELERRGREISAQVGKLSRKPKPRRPKPAATTSVSTPAAPEATEEAAPTVSSEEGAGTAGPPQPEEATPPRHGDEL